MQITRENYEQLLPSLRLASSQMSGSERRRFLGQLALDIGYGGRLLVSRTLNIGRSTLRKGIAEIESGVYIADKFDERGRHLTEKNQPELAEDIRQIVDGASQTDPQFKSTRLYTRLSPASVLTALKKRGYTEEELPCENTIGNIMKRLGYKRRKVAKTKPKKKIKETDAIFEQLNEEHTKAVEDEGTLRISFDAKNKVAIGDFSRGGKNWSEVKASDHDFAKEHLVPFGFYLPDYQETMIFLVESKVTADCIVDLLEAFWQRIKERFDKVQVHTLLLNVDNGPECHSRRTWFMFRICQFAVEHNLNIKLCYYPPYHSKYNPIERVWGGLEQHWNADILDTKTTVLKFIESFVWAEKKAKVAFWNHTYQTGKKLTKKAMNKVESAIDRLNEEIGKWFVNINPNKVHKQLEFG